MGLLEQFRSLADKVVLLLVVIVPGYDKLAERYRRIRVLNISYAVVLVGLVVFYVLGSAGVPIKLPYFVWFGLVSIFLIAQFWSYANDIYTQEQGTRLFAIIATGGALGAILGPRIAHFLLPIPGKRDSDWGYAWIPIVGPLIGGVIGAQLFKAVGF